MAIITAQDLVLLMSDEILILTINEVDNECSAILKKLENHFSDPGIAECYRWHCNLLETLITHLTMRHCTMV